MEYEEYEDKVVERLKMPGVDVSALPFLESLNEARQINKPRIFLMYNHSVYGEPENLGGLVQKETLNFEVFIKCKNRRGKTGIFTITQEIKKRLMGWKPTDAITPVTLSHFGYVAGIQNNWQYMVTFSFDRYAVQQPYDKQPPLIKKITNNTKSVT